MKKLFALLLAALMLCGTVSALAAPDMEHSYCNPLNLDFVDVRAGGGQTFNAEAPALDMGGSVKTYSLSLHSAGTHTVTIGGAQYTFTNATAYGKTTVYSDTTVSA